MSLNKLNAFTQKVADAADQLIGNPAGNKAIFDAAVEELRQYFNNSIDGLKSTASGDSGAKNLGATAITGLTGTDVQSLLESLNTNKVGKTFSGWTAAPLFTASGWSAYGNGMAAPAYNVDDAGWVTFKGAAKGGLGGSWVVLMPTGLRPAENQKFNCAMSSGSVGVTVVTDGSFVIDATPSGYVDLSAIRYKIV